MSDYFGLRTSATMVLKKKQNWIINKSNEIHSDKETFKCFVINFS